MSTAEPIGLLRPSWSAPPHIRAAFSLRSGGVSLAPWASLNLGRHVGDEANAVQENRSRLASALRLPSEPVWLEQVHGTTVWRLVAPTSLVTESTAAAPPPRADAIVVERPRAVAAIMVADCLPVLFCDRAGSVVAAAHAGWRGLVAGVLEQTVAAMGVPPAHLLAWMGPAIGPSWFEVGPEVRHAFLAASADSKAPAAGRAIEVNFRRGPGDRWMCDLGGLARQRLQALGIGEITGAEWCTASDPARFFSHRRDASRTGRMAAVIWMEHAAAEFRSPPRASIDVRL